MKRILLLLPTVATALAIAACSTATPVEPPKVQLSARENTRLPEQPGFQTIGEALQAIPLIGSDVSILQERPLDRDRAVLFRTGNHPALQVCLVLREEQGWRVDTPVFLSAIADIGPPTFRRENLGLVHEDGFTRARVNAIYGEVQNPEISWVEVALAAPDSDPQQATLAGQTWLALVDMTDVSRDTQAVQIRAGGAGGTLFTARP